MPGVFFASSSARYARASSTLANSPITTRYHTPLSPRSTSTARPGFPSSPERRFASFSADALAVLVRREVDDVDDGLARPVGRQEQRGLALRHGRRRGRRRSRRLRARRRLQACDGGLRGRRGRERDGVAAGRGSGSLALLQGRGGGRFHFLDDVAREERPDGPEEARRDREDDGDRDDPARLAALLRRRVAASAPLNANSSMAAGSTGSVTSPTRFESGGISDIDLTGGSIRRREARSGASYARVRRFVSGGSAQAARIPDPAAEAPELRELRKRRTLT
jgi:hypothetical protein